jgi:hypothetical protein
MINFLVLLAILALLMFGPRRGGRMPSRAGIVIGIVILVWLAIAFGVGSLWNKL